MKSPGRCFGCAVGLGSLVGAAAGSGEYGIDVLEGRTKLDWGTFATTTLTGSVVGGALVVCFMGLGKG